MNPGESADPADISPEAMRDVAASGAVCDDCGGLCIPNIAVAILAVNAAQDSKVAIPFCACSECPVCGPFRAGMAALNVRKREPRHSEEPIHD